MLRTVENHTNMLSNHSN